MRSIELPFAEKKFSCYPLSDLDKSGIRNRAGVYVVICKKLGGKYDVLDVGESGKLLDRLKNHDRRSCWERNCKASIWVCVHEMPSVLYTDDDRRQLESQIRDEFDPPCGDR